MSRRGVKQLATLLYITGLLLLVTSSTKGAEEPFSLSAGVRGGVAYTSGPCGFYAVGGEICGRAEFGFAAVQASVGQTNGIRCNIQGVVYGSLGLVTNTSPLYAGVLVHAWLNETFSPRWFIPIAGVRLDLFRSLMLLEVQLSLPQQPGGAWGFQFLAGMLFRL